MRSGLLCAVSVLLVCVVAEAGGTPNATLTAIADNTALDLGAYVGVQVPGSGYPGRGITDYSGFTHDPYRHKIYMFGGGHATTFRDDVDVFHFDTLTWVSDYAPTPASEWTEANFDSVKCRWISTDHPLARHTYDLLAVAGSSHDFILMRGGGGTTSGVPDVCMWVWGLLPHYDPDAKTWTWSGTAGGGWDGTSTSEVDPISGLVVVVSRTGLWAYDADTQTPQQHLSYNKSEMGYANNLVYFPPNQKMYYIARGSPNRVWEVTLDRTTWSNSTVVEVTGIGGTAPDSGESGWAYDTANEVIGGGVKDGVFYAYDPVANEWSSSTMTADSAGGNTVGALSFHAIDYDPVDSVFILISDGSGGRRTWAYSYLAPEPDLTPPTVPANLQTSPVSDTAIDLAWDASSDPESGVASYTVYRDNVEIATNVVVPSYSDTDLSESTTYDYQVLAVNGRGLESALCTAVPGTTLADTTAPALGNVSAGSATTVEVVFSEPVAQASVELTGNYAITYASGSVTVSTAVLQGDGVTVVLTTGSALQANTTYTLTVNGVTDLAAAPNTIAADSQDTFVYFAQTVLVDFGPSAGTDTYGLAGWDTTISDTYTTNVDIGPGGMTITTGSNETYNFQGVTGTSRTFAEGERLVVTWYNEEASSITFTPKISFDDPDRRISGTSGTWYDMTELTITAAGTATNEYQVDAGSSGTYTLVNVNGNYSNSGTLVCDKIELAGSASNQPPDAAVSASSTSVTVGEDPGLDGSGSTDPDGTIQSYEWDFDYDGATFDVQATGATPAWTYAVPGTYTVALRVTDNEGASDVATVQVVVWADDGDGIPDWWEIEHFGDASLYDETGDPDNDDFSNLQEYQAGSNPNNPDTDGDGIPDGDDRDPTHAPEPFAGGCGAAPSVAVALWLMLVIARRRADLRSPI